METFKRFFVGAVFITTVMCTVFFAVKSYNTGRLCNELTERITVATDTNTRLAVTIADCQSICGQLESSVTRNITTATEAIDLIEEVRTQVYNLEILLDNFDWDDYYNNLDACVTKP